MKVIRDGNAFAVVLDDFINLQESQAAFYEEGTEIFEKLDIGGLLALSPVNMKSICDDLGLPLTAALEQRLRLLAAESHLQSVREENVKACNAAVDATPEAARLADANAELAITKGNIDQLRRDINCLTVMEYGESQNKKPVSGVGIRVSQVYNYDQGKAKDYCLAELPEALKLDTKTFEMYVKGVQEVKPLDFVTVEEKVTPTIASDLSEYLEDK